MAAGAKSLILRVDHSQDPYARGAGRAQRRAPILKAGRRYR
jgi:hypothetical protein